MSKQSETKTPTDTAQSLDTVRDLGLDAVEAWVDVWSDLVSFGAERLRQDIITWHAAVHCRKPDELYRLQVRHFEKALDEYREETARLMDLGRRIPVAKEMIKA